MLRTLSDGHISDDSLYSILPLVAILTVQVRPKLEVFALLIVNTDSIKNTI
jgi:hypothetical protein